MFNLFLLLLLPSIVFAGSTFTIHLQPHEKRCYLENLQVGDRLDLSFQVGSGGSLDIDFWVSTPENRLLYSVFRQSTATYGFVAEQGGRYEYCFSNQMSSVTDKILSFSVMGPDERMNVKPEKENISIDPIEQAIRELSDGLKAIKDEQMYMESRERAHKRTAMSTNSRVVWWSLGETLLLIGVCVWQISYLKRFFEVKRVV